MRKHLISLFSLLLALSMLISCDKETTEEQINMEQLLNEDVPQMKVGPARPDLIISDYFTDIGVKSILCSDVPLETTHCDVGPRKFKASIDIDNIGSLPLAPGIVEVFWYDLTRGLSVIQPYSHNGIPIGGQITVSHSYYVGPCDCVDLPGDDNCFIHSYLAIVDPSLAIKELDENNNVSEIHNTCDGCGPCAIEPEPNIPLGN